MHATLSSEGVRRQVAGAVREARREQGLRQDELALTAGISTKTLHNLETGATGIKVATLLGILRVLGLTLEIVPRAPSFPIRGGETGSSGGSGGA